MRKIWMPILSLVLAAIVLLGLYNGLLQVRQNNYQVELQAKMETLLPRAVSPYHRYRY